MVGEWFGCNHRAGSFTGPKGTRHSDAISHAVLVGKTKLTAMTIVQRVQTSGEGQEAAVDPNLVRGTAVAIALSSLVWNEGTAKYSASAVIPIAAPVRQGGRA
jgi:hypothetical protein